MFFKRAKKSDQVSAAAEVTAIPVSAPEKPAAQLPLDADKLRRTIVATKLGFKTTADISTAKAEPFEARRVWDTLRSAFAAESTPAKPRQGVFIEAPRDCGALRALATHLATLPHAVDAAAPDWIFVRDTAAAPWKAVPVPAGQGKRFAAGIEAVVAQLRTTLPYLLSGEDLKLRRATIEAGFAAVRDDAFARLRTMAEAQNVAVLTTPMGFAVAPMHEGKVVKPEVLARLPQAMRDEVRRKVEGVEAELQSLLADVPAEANTQISELSELVTDYARPAVATGFEGLVKEFSGVVPAMAFLTAVQDDIIRRACREGAALTLPDYSGRVIEGAGKSVVSLATSADADTIAHALLRAGKGAVLIDATRLDAAPAAWAALKSALLTRTVTLGDLPGHALPIASGVVVLGEPQSAERHERSDPDFAALFRIRSAFAAEAARSDDSETALARMIAAGVEQQGILPLEAAAVALLICEAARATGRPDRLSSDLSLPLAVAADAGRLAAVASRTMATEADVQAALVERRASASVQPLFAPVAPSIVGRVLAAGLAPEPVEVWATVRPGRGTALDIARAGSPAVDTPSSASALLWSYVAGRFVPTEPLSLAAAIVHEPPLTAAALARASAAEIYALLSALAGTPVATSFAAAGWVSPSGALLPVPGINAAIESTYDHSSGRDTSQPLCIVIPRANETDLMLRTDLVEAARKGKLKIFTAGDVDEGLSILTGIKSGTRTDAASEPSLNRQIEERLVAFARQSAVGDTAAQQAARTTAKAAAQ